MGGAVGPWISTPSPLLAGRESMVSGRRRLAKDPGQQLISRNSCPARTPWLLLYWEGNLKLDPGALLKHRGCCVAIVYALTRPSTLLNTTHCCTTNVQGRLVLDYHVHNWTVTKLHGRVP